MGVRRNSQNQIRVLLLRAKVQELESKEGMKMKKVKILTLIFTALSVSAFCLVRSGWMQEEGRVDNSNAVYLTDSKDGKL
jgi:hypothetical protein